VGLWREVSAVSCAEEKMQAKARIGLLDQFKN